MKIIKLKYCGNKDCVRMENPEQYLQSIYEGLGYSDDIVSIVCDVAEDYKEEIDLDVPLNSNPDVVLDVDNEKIIIGDKEFSLDHIQTVSDMFWLKNRGVISQDLLDKILTAISN